MPAADPVALRSSLHSTLDAVAAAPCRRMGVPCRVVWLTPPTTVLPKLPSPEKRVRMPPGAIQQLRQDLLEGLGAQTAAVDAVVDAHEVSRAVRHCMARPTVHVCVCMLDTSSAWCPPPSSCASVLPCPESQGPCLPSMLCRRLIPR